MFRLFDVVMVIDKQARIQIILMHRLYGIIAPTVGSSEATCALLEEVRCCLFSQMYRTLRGLLCISIIRIDHDAIIFIVLCKFLNKITRVLLMKTLIPFVVFPYPIQAIFVQQIVHFHSQHPTGAPTLQFKHHLNTLDRGQRKRM